MKTEQYFIDDEPLQILFLDLDKEKGHDFFNSSLGSSWFDYELHMLDQTAHAANFLDTNQPHHRPLDLLLISNNIWFRGGEDLVKQIRSHQSLALLPIYIIVSCNKANSSPSPTCWSESWRKDANCTKNHRISTISFEIYKEDEHPARINGTLCPFNISIEIPKIIRDMNTYFIHSDKE